MIIVTQVLHIQYMYLILFLQLTYVLTHFWRRETEAEKALEKAVAKAKAELQLANFAKRKLAEELASTKSRLKDMTRE